MPMTKSEESLAHLRAWWFRRQGLTLHTSAKTVADCLRQTGWLATVGSTGVYFSMRARLPGISRETIDRAVMDGVDVIEIPGAHAAGSTRQANCVLPHVEDEDSTVRMLAGESGLFVADDNVRARQAIT
jgi:hypothetical protein